MAVSPLVCISTFWHHVPLPVCPVQPMKIVIALNAALQADMYTQRRTDDSHLIPVLLLSIHEVACWQDPIC